MKRALALRHVATIVDRLNACRGLLHTKGCDWPAVEVREVWLFGSLLTDKPDPGDVDIEIDMRGVGMHQGVPAVPYDIPAYRLRGVKVPRCALQRADEQLRGGMKLVRLAKPSDVGISSSQRRMIWPVMEFDPDTPLPPAKRHEADERGTLIPHAETNPAAIARSKRWA